MNAHGLSSQTLFGSKKQKWLWYMAIQWVNSFPIIPFNNADLNKNGTTRMRYPYKTWSPQYLDKMRCKSFTYYEDNFLTITTQLHEPEDDGTLMS